MLEEISVLPGRARLRCRKLFMDKSLAKYINVYTDTVNSLLVLLLNKRIEYLSPEGDKKRTAAIL